MQTGISLFYCHSESCCKLIADQHNHTLIVNITLYGVMINSLITFSKKGLKQVCSYFCIIIILVVFFLVGYIVLKHILYSISFVASYMYYIWISELIVYLYRSWLQLLMLSQRHRWLLNMSYQTSKNLVFTYCQYCFYDNRCYQLYQNVTG